MGEVAKFGDFGLSRFGFIVRTDRHTQTVRITDADDRYTKHTTSQSCSSCDERPDNDDKRHVSLTSVVYECRPPTASVVDCSFSRATLLYNTHGKHLLMDC